MSRSNLFRVRDKNTDKAKGTVWGENLTFHDARSLRESLVGSNKSQTARVVSMDEDEGTTAPPPLPPKALNDPYLLQSRQNAKGAAAQAAQAAQRRADAITARDAAAKKALEMAPPEMPEFDEADLDGDGELDAGDADLAIDAT